MPARLRHPQRGAVGEQVDHLADQDLEVLVGGVAERGAHRHQPGDVPVVVGAEHDEAAVEAALALVEVVGQVAREVGRLAVGPDDDPVLVVAVLLGAQPERAVLLVGVAELGEPVDRLLHGAALVQVVLVEVDVEVDAEVVQRGLDLVEHQLDADAAEDLLRLVLGQVEGVGALLEDVLDDLGDVGAAVAVLGGRLAAGAGQQGPGEPVDLGAVVVEVVLPGDLGPGELEDPAERVTHGGPAGAADVQRAGRVGGDELEVDLLAGEGVVAAVRRPGRDDVGRHRALGAGLDPDVEEPRTGDLDVADPVGVRAAPWRAARPGRAAPSRPSCPAGGPRWWRSRRGRGPSAAPPRPSTARRRAASRRRARRAW